MYWRARRKISANNLLGFLITVLPVFTHRLDLNVKCSLWCLNPGTVWYLFAGQDLLTCKLIYQLCDFAT